MRMLNEKKNNTLWYFIVLLILGSGFFYITGGREKVKSAIQSMAGTSQEAIDERIHSILTNEMLSSRLKEIIQKDPGLIVSAFEEGQKTKQAEAEANVAKSVSAAIKDREANLKNSDFAPVAGASKAPINIYYFYDYNCGYCKKGASTIKEILTNNKDVAVHYIPVAFLSKGSEEALRVVTAAYLLDHDKFFKLHEALLSSTKPADLVEAKKLAKTIGINDSALETELAKPELEQAVKSLKDFAQKSQIRAIPFFAVNDQVVRGAVPYSDLNAIITGERSKIKNQEGK